MNGCSLENMAPVPYSDFTSEATEAQGEEVLALSFCTQLDAELG